MEQQPNNPAEKQTLSPVDQLALAYYGLRNQITERRLNMSVGRAERAVRSEEFFSDLGRVANETLAEGPDNGRNMPPPVSAITNNFLSKQAAFYRKEEVQSKPEPIALDPQIAPQNRQQRRAQRNLAKQVEEIRQGRIDNNKARVMFGNTGLHSKWRTRLGKAKMAIQDNIDYRNGVIDSTEFLDRKKQRKSLSIKKSSIRDRSVGTVAPPVMFKRAAKLKRMEKSTTIGINYAVKNATLKQVEETNRQAKLRQKIDKRRQAQQNIRNKIA